MEERIQKILSRAGIGSRRACEELILAGRVTVNGRQAEIGQKADPATDRIVVDGQPIQAAEPPVYIAMYKPRNVLSVVESEPGDTRKTVRDLIPMPGHLYPVGRLDFDSEGLVLMTNDGELANRLTHPRFGHEKIYRVLVARQPDPQQLETWRRGVVLEDGHKTLPAQVSLETKAGKGAWLRITMREGRKRQIREIGSLLGLPVVRILRIAIGSLRLGNLKAGEWRPLSEEEIAVLRGQKPYTARAPRGRRTSTARAGAPVRKTGGAAGRPAGKAAGNRPARSSRPSPSSKPGGDKPQRKPRPAGASRGPKKPGR